MPSRNNCPIDADTARCIQCNLPDTEMLAGKCRDPKTGNSQPFVYASIDIETTGLCSDYDQLIQFGIVLDDLFSPVEELPSLELLVLSREDRYAGSSFALNMHADLWKRISEITQKVKDSAAMMLSEWCYDDELTERVVAWLLRYGWKGDPLLCAGKNFASFDRPFLESVEGWTGMIRMHHRTLDPMPLFYHPAGDRSRPPGMAECLRRAGLPANVEHTALADALDIVRLVRKGYGL